MPLFQRSHNFLQLTEGGKIYYHYAEEILAIMKRTRNTIDNLEQLPDHELHVGVSSFGGAAILAKSMLKFFEHYPRVSLIHHEGFSPSLIRMVREGEINFALGAIDQSHKKGMKVIPFTRNEIVLLTPPFHRKSHPIKAFHQLPKVSLEEFRDDVFVMFSKDVEIYYQLMEYFKEAWFWPTVSYSLSNPIMQKELILSGCGCGFSRYDPNSELPQFRLDPPAYSDISIIAAASHEFTREERYLIYLMYQNCSRLSEDTVEPGLELKGMIQEFHDLEII